MVIIIAYQFKRYNYAFKQMFGQAFGVVIVEFAN